MVLVMVVRNEGKRDSQHKCHKMRKYFDIASVLPFKMLLCTSKIREFDFLMVVCVGPRGFHHYPRQLV